MDQRYINASFAIQTKIELYNEIEKLDINIRYLEINCDNKVNRYQNYIALLLLYRTSEIMSVRDN